MSAMIRKTIRPRQWEYGVDPIVVDLTPVEEPYMSARVYDVHRDGKYLGRVRSWSGSLDRKISGSRLVVRGKQRRLWAANPDGDSAVGGYDYFRHHVSMADAIRVLLGRDA